MHNDGIIFNIMNNELSKGNIVEVKATGLVMQVVTYINPAVICSFLNAPNIKQEFLKDELRYLAKSDVDNSKLPDILTQINERNKVLTAYIEELNKKGRKRTPKEVTFQDLIMKAKTDAEVVSLMKQFGLMKT